MEKYTGTRQLGPCISMVHRSPVPGQARAHAKPTLIPLLY